LLLLNIELVFISKKTEQQYASVVLIQVAGH